MSTRLRLAASLMVLVMSATGVGFLLLRPQQQPSDVRVLQDSALLQGKLMEAGLDAELATMFSTGATEVVSSGPGRAHFVRDLPALALRQDVFVAILPNQQLDISGVRKLPISAGPAVYPLHHSVEAVPGRISRSVAVFLPYDSIDPSALEGLGLQRRSSTRTTHPIAKGSGFAIDVSGIVIATFTSTTGSGLGDTAPGAGYDPGTGNTAPQAVPPAPPANPPAGKAPQVIVVQAPEQWGDGTAGPSQQQIQDWRDYSRTRPPESEFLTQEQADHMRRTNRTGGALRARDAFARADAARRAQPSTSAGPQACVGTTGGSAASVASNAIPNMLQTMGAAEAVLQARSQFEANAADRASGNELIDAYERAFRGETGNATADALARRALTEDPLGTQQTAERIAEARNDLALNAAIRGINTSVGNGAAVLTGPASPITSAVISVGTSALDAVLRDAHNSILSGLDRGSGELSQRAQDLIRNRQTPEITNTLGPAPGQEPSHRVDGSGPCEEFNAAPGEGQALVVIDVTEADGRHITFRTTVNLTNEIFSGSGFVDPDEYHGTGTGSYREVFVSDQCGFTITWTAPQMPVKVNARLSDRSASAGVYGPFTQNGEWPLDCQGDVYYAPNKGASEVGMTCYWEGVDFSRPSTSRGEPPYEGCSLTLGPLATSAPRPR